MNKLRKVRLTKGLNQRELAELSHTAQSLVSMIELGRIKPWFAVAKRLSSALNIPIQDLFPKYGIHLSKKQNDLGGFKNDE